MAVTEKLCGFIRREQGAWDEPYVETCYPECKYFPFCTRNPYSSEEKAELMPQHDALYQK